MKFSVFTHNESVLSIPSSEKGNHKNLFFNFYRFLTNSVNMRPLTKKQNSIENENQKDLFIDVTCHLSNWQHRATVSPISTTTLDQY